MTVVDHYTLHMTILAPMTKGLQRAEPGRLAWRNEACCLTHWLEGPRVGKSDGLKVGEPDRHKVGKPDKPKAGELDGLRAGGPNEPKVGGLDKPNN